MTSYQRFLLIGYSFSVLVNVASWLGIILFIPHDLPTVILHYNIFFGPDGFGNWYELFTIPVIGLVIIGLNAAASVWLQRRERFLASIAVYISGVVQLTALVAVIALIEINRF